MPKSVRGAQMAVASRRWEMPCSYSNAGFAKFVKDIKSGLVVLRVDWHDRALVAEWANGLVELANEELRKRAIADANATLVVLERELARAEAVELQSALSRLIESQLKTRTIAAVRKEYAFKVIDPATTPDPDKRVKPTRTLIVLWRHWKRIDCSNGRVGARPDPRPQHTGFGRIAVNATCLGFSRPGLEVG